VRRRQTGFRKGWQSRGLLVDANILVLYLVGSLDPGLIGRHKRLDKFTIEDFRLLEELLSPLPSIVTTPNVLTEVSNLVVQIGGPTKEKLRILLAALLQRGVFQEHAVESVEASRVEEFRRIGLTDAGIVLMARRGWAVLTDDLPLYLALQAHGVEAINFNHLREKTWQ
jgi:hypothetical protein